MTVARSSSRSMLLLLSLSLIGPTALAVPPGWEAQYGAELLALTGADDSAENVTLSFEFPFAGETFTVVSANNNGGLAFSDDPAVINIIHWHIWHKNAFQLDFTSAPFPSLLAFNTDLDLTSAGTIYFNDFGDRAVFTWDGVATNRSPQSPFVSFQVALYPDGHFSYSYVPLAGDPVADLDEGIVVGFSSGRGALPSGSVDLTAAPMSVLSTAYQVWCYDEDPGADPATSNCFEPGQDNNAGFDLTDNLTLLFEPDGSGGYLVSTQQPEAAPPPPAPSPPLPAAPPSSGGGGAGTLLLGLLVLTTLLRLGASVQLRRQRQTWQGCRRA